MTNSAVVPLCYDSFTIGPETAEFQEGVRCDACSTAAKCMHFVNAMECIPPV